MKPRTKGAAVVLMFLAALSLMFTGMKYSHEEKILDREHRTLEAELTLKQLEVELGLKQLEKQAESKKRNFLSHW